MDIQTTKFKTTKNTQPWLEHYEEGVPHIVNAPDLPLYEVLRQTANRYPQRIAVRLILRYLPLGMRIGSTMTYAQLEEASNRFAAALHAAGIKQNDRVAIMLPNIPQQIISYFGIIKAGAIVVNTNPTYTAREVKNLLQDSGAETIITLSGMYKRVEEARQGTKLKRIIITDIVDSVAFHWRLLAQRKLRAIGMMADVPPAPDIINFHTFLKQHPAQPPEISYTPDDVVLFQYTGGTTGVPKAAMLTHRNLINNVYQIQAWISNVCKEENNEKLLGTLPFFHVYGMSCGLLSAPAMAAELIISPDPRNTELIMEIIHREKVTVYPGVPAMYNAILNHPMTKKFDLSTIRACLSGGASLPVEVANKFEKLTGGYLVEGYGLSEASPVVAANPLRGERRVGSIGLPFPSTNVEIVTIEPNADGEFLPVAPGEEGELVVYAPQVMKGYWNDQEASTQSINRRGGLHTGDIVRMDQDGYLYVVDRKKDIIISGGYNIVPREVEEILYMHPKVLEACVVGIPHRLRGELVKAFIVLKPGETATVDEIRKFCKEYLVTYKVPKSVEFRQEIPKSQVGKMLRRVLVEEEVAKQKDHQEKIIARHERMTQAR